MIDTGLYGRNHFLLGATMLMYSTILDVREPFTQDDFIQLAIEWNQSSPNEEHVISGISWNGNRNIRYGDESHWLGIEEYRNENTVAIRYEKTNCDGVVWDTDFIMNFDEMKIAIQLDRSFVEGAQVEDYRCYIPFFLSILIDGGYLEDDNGIPVSRNPVYITEDNLELLASVINQENRFALPIVYVSKTSLDCAPVNVDSLCKRLKGIAHVLVEQSNKLDPVIRDACKSKNEYRGGIGVYLPNGKHRRFLCQNIDGDNIYVENKVVRLILQYTNAQKIEPLYTWHGVTYSLLKDRKKAADDARQLAESQTEQFVGAFDQENAELQQKIDELTKTNESLKAEIRGLREKLMNSDGLPLLFFGNEEEYFPDEIKEMVIEAIEKQADELGRNGRRADVLNDVLERNSCQRVIKQRKEELKKVLADYSKMTSAKKSKLEDLGFTITSGGKHFDLVYYDDSRYHTTLPKTGSDHRGGKNAAADIIRNMM